MTGITIAACARSSTDGGQASKIAVLDGFLRPESMRYDPDQDVWFVSNVNGGTERDNNGYISRVSGQGKLENRRFIAGGEKGVTLHGPKGMVIAGDTLWVTDISAVRGFHRRTGLRSQSSNWRRWERSS